MSETLTAKDFATSQEVRWCPGCGDYAILKSVTKALADVGARPESTAFISGIGCAARFPSIPALVGELVAGQVLMAGCGDVYIVFDPDAAEWQEGLDTLP